MTAVLPSLLALWACSGPDGRPAERSVEVPEERLASAEARQRGRRLFLDHCTLCHGERADGRGVRRNLSTPAADLTDPFWRSGATPRAIFRSIREGVPGTPMASWRSLSVEETWDLVAYLLRLEEETEGDGS